MEERALPLIFLNLCGEMLYVIMQRLEAQSISPDKKSKVIQDILSTMLNEQFLEELFKPQKMYTRLAMQSVFEKLVHSSIMRLNSNSMNKLYDLMLMVFKYQVLNCQHPQDILLVTLNHLNAIKKCSNPFPELLERVRNLFSMVKSNYGALSYKDYECLYKCINAFLENLNVRVSVLMKLGFQLPNGEIVISKNQLQPTSESEDTESLKQDYLNFDYDGKRNFNLGTNIYILSGYIESSQSIPPQSLTSSDSTNCLQEKDSKVEEISLLTRLIGKCTSTNCTPEILLASPDDEEHNLVEKYAEPENCSVINIDASQVSKQNLDKISKELSFNEDNTKFDILDLLDTAESI